MWTGLYAVRCQFLYFLTYCTVFYADGTLFTRSVNIKYLRWLCNFRLQIKSVSFKQIISTENDNEVACLYG
jgi:hypothetical protein